MIFPLFIFLFKKTHFPEHSVDLPYKSLLRFQVTSSELVVFIPLKLGKQKGWLWKDINSVWPHFNHVTFFPALNLFMAPHCLPESQSLPS